MSEYSKIKPESIQELFDSIAHRYDQTNGLLSFQLHRYWNRELIKQVIKRKSPQTMLDLCAGTGEIAFGIQGKTKNLVETYLLDFSKEMLACAKKKEPVGIHHTHYIHGDAQNVPLENGTMDVVTIAYGIRNVKEPNRCIHEAYRVLKPGGVFGILELTQPDNQLLRLGHTFYLKSILPLVGKLMTKNKSAYEYLCKSIPQFIPPAKLVSMMMDEGFKELECRPLSGGIATIVLGVK